MAEHLVLHVSGCKWQLKADGHLAASCSAKWLLSAKDWWHVVPRSEHSWKLDHVGTACAVHIAAVKCEIAHARSLQLVVEHREATMCPCDSACRCLDFDNMFICIYIYIIYI